MALTPRKTDFMRTKGISEKKFKIRDLDIQKHY